MAKYLPKDLVVRSTGPTATNTGNVYATLVEDLSTGNALFAVIFDDENMADQLAQNIAVALNAALIVDIG
jgi:hypothetical protein